jgi:hypothetical protein
MLYHSALLGAHIGLCLTLFSLLVFLKREDTFFGRIHVPQEWRRGMKEKQVFRLKRTEASAQH